MILKEQFTGVSRPISTIEKCIPIAAASAAGKDRGQKMNGISQAWRKRAAGLCLLLLAAALLHGCGQGDNGQQEPGDQAADPVFLVETDFEYDYSAEGYTVDIRMPKVSESVPGGEEINERLGRYNTQEQLLEAETWLVPDKGNSLKRYYSVSRQGALCSLDLICEQYPLDQKTGERDFSQMAVTEVESWYYDEKKQEVISQETYLKVLGLSEEDILDQFLMEYGERYSDRVYGFSDLIFWFDEGGKIQFSTNNIDAMDSNTADFDLLIDGKAYAMGTEEKFPGGGKLLSSKDEYSAEVWAGSWWRTEVYENGRILYSLDPDTKETAVCQVSVTGSDRTSGNLPEIRTLRGAGLGDSRQQILQLYPEIDEREQQRLTGSSDELWIEGEGGYLNLTFLFKGDKVAELRTSILID